MQFLINELSELKENMPGSFPIACFVRLLVQNPNQLNQLFVSAQVTILSTNRGA